MNEEQDAMPHRKRKKKIRNNAYEFYLICLLARRCDAEGVRRILRRGNCIALRQNMLTPVMVMAMEGNDRAVWMLIQNFDVSLQHVVEGYARAGRHEKVKEFLELGASPWAAAGGYLLGGFTGEAVDCTVSMQEHFASQEEKEKYRNFLHENRQELYQQLTQGLYKAAEAGRFKEVEARLAKGEDIDDAVFGYAAGGYVRQVENIISRGAERKEAMKGYAAGGFLDQVKHTWTQYGIPLFHAVELLASNGLHGYVQQIYESDSFFKDQVVREAGTGYDDAGFFRNEKIAVRLLVSIRHDELRNRLARFAEFRSAKPEKHFKLNSTSLLKKAEKIRKIMQEFDVNYDQAVALHTPGLITWLLQPPPSLSRDMHLKIAAEMANTTYDTIKIVSEAVAETTYEGAVKNIEYKHAPGFFQRWGCSGYDEKLARKKVQDEVAELDERYLSPERRVGLRNP